MWIRCVVADGEEQILSSAGSIISLIRPRDSNFATETSSPKQWQRRSYEEAGWSTGGEMIPSKHVLQQKSESSDI